MTAQAKHYYSTDFTGQNEMVRAYIESNPQSSIAQIGKALNLQKSSVSRAVNALKSCGALIVSARPSGDVYAFDTDESNWPKRSNDLAREKQLSRIQKFAADFAPRLSAAGTQMLRELYRDVRANPL